MSPHHYQVGKPPAAGEPSSREGKGFNPESLGSIYNAWAASLTPGVTLNSGELITIDWASCNNSRMMCTYTSTLQAAA